MNTKEQVLNLIKEHDVYFEFSDDHREWQNGTTEKDRILTLLRELPLSTVKEIITEHLPKEVQARWFLRFEGLD